MTSTVDRSNKLYDRLDDLAAGQVNPLGTWWLRLRIARDPDMARRWAELQRLRVDLRYLIASGRVGSPVQNGPLPPVPVITLGGFVMKRRTAFAAAAVCLLSVTGATASRMYLDRGMSASFTDQNHTSWTIRTTMPGKLQLVNRDGQPERDHQWESPSVYLPSDKIEVNSETSGRVVLHGYGRHPLRSTSGNLIGYLDAAPYNAQDQRRTTSEDDANVRSYASLVRDPEVFTDRTPHAGDQWLGSWTGVVAGYFFDTGVAYKLVGYGHVTATCRTGNPQTVDANALPLPSLTYIPSATRENAARIMALAPPLNSEPQVYWQIANKTDHTVVDGHWKIIERSGHFTGYGRFDVRNGNGETVLTLDVKP